MGSIGETLRQARHNKKVSLEDASRATKVKVEILERLESEEFAQLVAPAYTKGFLKLYAEYLGLDSQAIVDAYLQSQGGLRRQGLLVETEAAARARPKRELQLPIRQVVLAVATMTLVVLAILLGRNLWSWRARPTVVKTAPAMPNTDFDAYYKPKVASELLEPAGK
jgi:cytoskeletal protein RodZ